MTTKHATLTLIRKENHTMPISSQALPKSDEGSEAISKESRVQANPKRPAPKQWGDDIAQSSWKREAALKKLVQNMSISEKGCWEWTGATTLGYGSTRIPELYGTFKIMVHGLAWVAFKGEAIPDGLFVCHHCDNPKCFNPDHLFAGTQQENLQDCSRKGRTMTGSLNGNSKYTIEQIKRVVELLKEGMPGKEIHSITGISRTHISRIKRGYTWKVEMATEADMVNHNRKYSDEQIVQAAKLIKESKVSNGEIAKLCGISRYTVLDMKRGRLYQRFMERATW
jgi:hypothetical protein